MISETQTLEGIKSKVVGRKGYHFPLFDIERPRGERLDIEDVERELSKIQVSYGLPDIRIFSDKLGSYRSFCFGEVRFTDYIRMELDLLDAGILDYNFFWWTINKGYSKLRMGPKKDRPKQECISTLLSYPVRFPEEKISIECYDTGIVKRGLTTFLGEKGRILWGNE
jgi:hypothetical protein